MERQIRRRRRRTPLACAACRRRKIRCDRKWPCSNCVTASEACVFDAGDGVSAARQSERDVNHDHDDHGHDPRLDLDLEPEPDGPLRTPSLDETSQTVLQRRSGLAKPRIHLNKTRILRFSHCMGLADEVAPIKDFFLECRRSMQSTTTDGDANRGSDVAALAFETAGFLQKCKHLARSRKENRPGRCLSPADLALTFPSREQADEMVSLYLRNFESTHRVVHIPTFKALYDEFWKESSEPASMDVRLLVYLVAVVGSSHCLGGENALDVRNKADHVVYAAQVWLAEPLAKHRFTVVGLQIYCLVVLARTLFTLGGDLTWSTAGDLLHRGMQMGLHRDPDHLPEMSILEAETRRRLWATIMEIVLQASLDSAMPARICVEEFDTRAPANLNDTDFDLATQNVRPRPMTEFTNTTVQLLLHSTIPVRLRALHLSFDLHAELSFREALVLEADLVEASRAARNFLDNSEISGATSLDRNMVDYMLQRFLILLHFPFSMEASKDPLFEHSTQVCIDAGETILYPEADETFACRLVHAGGMYREGLRMAVWVFSRPLLKLMKRHSSGEAAQHEASFRLHFLRKACDDMMALATRRIEHGGEMNINIHLFLSMAQAHADAMYQGVNVKPAIAQAARDSARACYRMLCVHNTVLSATFQDQITTDIDPGLGDSFDIDFDEFLNSDFFEF